MIFVSVLVKKVTNPREKLVKNLQNRFSHSHVMQMCLKLHLNTCVQQNNQFQIFQLNELPHLLHRHQPHVRYIFHKGRRPPPHNLHLQLQKRARLTREKKLQEKAVIRKKYRKCLNLQKIQLAIYWKWSLEKLREAECRRWFSHMIITIIKWSLEKPKEAECQ